MNGAGDHERASSTAVLASLGVAAVFEAVTAPETQDKTIWATSPWREDPYHTVVLFAEFAAPILALAIALRLLAWHTPGRQDRAQQTVRAAGTMVSFVGLTLAFEWAAVIGGANASFWGRGARRRSPGWS